MVISLDNLDQFGIGHNFSDPIYPQDFEFITYGSDIEANTVTTDSTVAGGETAWWKEPSFYVWWKIGLRAPASKE